SITIGEILLSGSTPVVNITYPLGGELLEGNNTIMWNITDPDSDFHYTNVLFSKDGGGSWEYLAQGLTGNNLDLDFDTLPGSDGNALIRIVTSDGVNSGESLSETFSIPKKAPIAEILFPTQNSIFKANELITFEGQGFDPEDGLLNGTWESSIDGLLGSGQNVSLSHLSELNHLITYEASDSDSNVANNSIDTFVDGTPPILNIDVITDRTPYSCVLANIDATDNQDGSGIDSIAYSIHGGI